MISLEKRSKKEQREYHRKQRGSWNGVCPVTRSVPSGKAYARETAARELRKAAALDTDLPP